MDQVKRTSPCSCAHDLHAGHSPPCSHITTGEAETRWDVVSPSNATFHARYHPLDEIHSFVRDLAAAYPKQVTIVPLGHSGEGREMFALEISASSELVVFGGKWKERGTYPRCGFLVTGAQHAREWIASSAALYIAHALLADPSEKFSLARLLERHNFYIVPVTNPDGYVYTWEKDRFWHKNRLQLGPETRCVGVDMNRNWGFKWKAKSNDFHDDQSRPEDPCSHWYPGSRPFQAPEVNNMENYFRRLPRLKGFLDLRSYGQMLSTPFSYSCKKTPKDAEDQLEAISGAAFAMKKSHGTHYMVSTLVPLSRAPGNIVDWMYKKMGVKYSFAAHLRDTGTYGFSLPEQWIRPVGEETSRMIEYLADFISVVGNECS
ncbi:Zn-dependent exopeptidase [Russula aff. rugulosa BPL654]|nr:Zn-dependent exopeptidase [Russula aff. rugulosa BPL654]